MSPELRRDNRATFASDVYALGVLMREVASGRLASAAGSLSGGEAASAPHHYNDASVSADDVAIDMVDCAALSSSGSNAGGGFGTMQEVFTSLSRACLSADPALRPSAPEVVSCLERLLFS